MKQIIDKINFSILKILICCIGLIGATGFIFNSAEPTMTYVEQITVSKIPIYRDVDQALFDEDLPVGALFIIAGEDYVRIKKYQL